MLLSSLEGDRRSTDRFCERSSEMSQTPQRTSSLPQLLLLAAAGFVTMLTETVPAGLLPAIGHSMGISVAATGQLLTAYAGASMIAAIPLVTLTSRLSRTGLVISTIAVVAAANLLTAASAFYPLAFAARVLGGSAAALQWALLAGFAMRLVPEERQGRALSIAMGGIPLALAIGVPLGTALGELTNWRTVFLIIAGIGVALTVLCWWLLPSIAASRSTRQPLHTTFRVPGFLVIVICAGLFQAGHMNVYTFVAPHLRDTVSTVPVSVFLLVLGLAAIVGLFITGAVIDAHLRSVTVIAMVSFTLGFIVLIAAQSTLPLLVSAVFWGIGLGSAPTIFQTACTRAAGPLVDQAQSILVTVFNAGMALGSAAGGLMLARSGSTTPLVWTSVAVFVVILTALTITRKRSLPASAASFAEPSHR